MTTEISDGVGQIPIHLEETRALDMSKQCVGKISYPNTDSAIMACHSIARKELENGRVVVIQPYRCPHCCGIHTGRIRGTEI